MFCTSLYTTAHIPIEILLIPGHPQIVGNSKKERKPISPEPRFQVVESRHGTRVLPEYRPVPLVREALPQPGAIVEGLLVIGPANLAELVLRESGEHGHEVGVGVVGDLVVAEHLHGAHVLEQLQRPGHRTSKVESGHGVDADDEDA